MVRFIIIILLALCAFAGGLALALFHWFGWQGLLAFPFVILLVAWLGKMVIGKLIKHFALKLFSMKSGVLKGATMQVHSVLAVAQPAKRANREITEGEEDEEDDSADDTANEADGEEAGAGEDSDAEEAEDDDQDDEDSDDEKVEGPKEYFEIDVTITPRAAEGVWEAGELILTSDKIASLLDLEEKQVGTTEEVLVWNGSVFGPDKEGKYSSTQRLKLTMAVKPGTSKAWVHYYNEPIGTLELPPWKPASEAAKSVTDIG
jgi:hypothetical protein